MRSVVASVCVFFAGCTFVVEGVGQGDGVQVDALVMDLAVDAPVSMTDATTMMDANTPADLRVVLGRRKSITIDDNRVTGNQSNFPVWIDITDNDLGARAQASGVDIYFTASNGTTKLDHEIQRWDAAGKRLTAWVRVPSLSSSAPTVLYLYYGDPAKAQAQTPAGVFSSSFAAVWHLDDSLPAATVADATGTHAGTPTLTTTTRVAAQLGSGFAFSGGSDRITFTNMLTGDNPHTISVWVNQQTTGDPSSVLVVGTPTQNQSRWFYTHFLGPAMAVGFYANDWTTTTNIDNVGWTLVHWVFEGNNGRNRIYRNGIEIAGSPQTLSNAATQGTSGYIGWAPEPQYGTNMGMSGTLDELRIATVARSAGWIATEHANQSSPGTFYTVGAEELAP